MRPKLSIKQQIEDMKDAGITLGELINLYQLFYSHNKYKDACVSLLFPMKVVRYVSARFR